MSRRLDHVEPAILAAIDLIDLGWHRWDAVTEVANGHWGRIFNLDEPTLDGLVSLWFAIAGLTDPLGHDISVVSS